MRKRLAVTRGGGRVTRRRYWTAAVSGAVESGEPRERSCCGGPYLKRETAFDEFGEFVGRGGDIEFFAHVIDGEARTKRVETGTEVVR